MTYRVDGNHLSDRDVGLPRGRRYSPPRRLMRLAGPKRVATPRRAGAWTLGATNELVGLLPALRLAGNLVCPDPPHRMRPAVGTNFAASPPCRRSSPTTHFPTEASRSATPPSRRRAVVGTVAEFTATQERLGQSRRARRGLDGAGLRVRPNWLGRTRPFADEVMMSVRFGCRALPWPPRRATSLHCSATATAVWWTAGSIPPTREVPVVLRRPIGAQPRDRGWGPAGDLDDPAALKRSSSTMFEVAMVGTPTPVRVQRRITFARPAPVRARRRSPDNVHPKDVRQLWHLREGTSPT